MLPDCVKVGVALRGAPGCRVGLGFKTDSNIFSKPSIININKNFVDNFSKMFGHHPLVVYKVW